MDARKSNLTIEIEIFESTVVRRKERFKQGIRSDLPVIIRCFFNILEVDRLTGLLYTQ